MNRISRYLVFSLAVFLLFSVSAWGQWSLTKFSSNVGKGAFISGSDASVELGDSLAGEKIIVTGNHQRCYAILAKDFPFHINAGISGGFYQNMPWVGPIIEFSPLKCVTFQHWSGVSAGLPNKPSWGSNEYIVINSVFLKAGWFCFSYVAMEYLQTWVTLPGVKLSVPINSNYTMTVGVEHKKTHYAKNEEALFNLGLSYAP